MALDPTILRDIIMDHYEYPRNKELTEKDGYMSRHMASDSCIDDITVQSKIENGIIEDVRSMELPARFRLHPLLS